MKPLRNLLLALVIAWAPMAAAQDVTGDWHGTLAPDQVNLVISLHVSGGADGYAATLDSPQQGAMGIPMDTFTLEGTTVVFTFAAANVRYEGTFDAAAQTIAGLFTQGGQPLPLAFGRQTPDIPAGPEWAVSRLKKTEVMIPMRDGVRLFTSIYTPLDTTMAVPILINRTPYNSEPSEERFSGKINSFRHMLEDGYILVLQDVRGRYMSEGTFENIRPLLAEKRTPEDIDEASDTYDTIEWLVKNVRGNNGRAGVLGISYPGFYSTTAIPGAHPALKAVSPQAPVTNWFLGDDWHHNGAFFLHDAFSFYSGNGVPRPEPTRRGPPPFHWGTQDNYRFFLDLGTIPNIVSTHLQGIEFWPEIIAHPNYDDFWKSRDPRAHLTGVKPAVLTVGGWFDAEDLWGALNVYRSIEVQNVPSTSNRIIMGPWSHGQWAGGQAESMGNVHWGRNTSADYKEMEKAFFDHYLKDEGPLELAEATMFDTGANRWDAFETWPPAGTREAALFLQPASGLSFAAPSARESFDEYVSDPAKPVPYTEDVHLYRTSAYMSDDQRFASRRPDVAVFSTADLTEAVTLTGPVEADLWVSTTGTDADYVVKLIDVFPDTLGAYPANDRGVPMAGYQMLVRGEVMRGRFRNSFEKPEPFRPGEVTRVRFSVPDVHHTFRKGHRIMVQVQHSWFPLVDRNPQTFVDIYQARPEDFVRATQRIYHDARRPSRLVVRVRE